MHVTVALLRLQLPQESPASHRMGGGGALVRVSLFSPLIGHLSCQSSLYHDTAYAGAANQEAHELLQVQSWALS